MKYYLAIDLGATSGRHIVGHIENENIVLDEVHRFATGMKDSKDGLIWDIEYLFEEIKKGIKIALEKYQNIESLAIDTWGVDYVLLNGDKEIKPCYAYRNKRTEAVVDELHIVIPFNELYKITGIQFNCINTIYQLFDDLKKGRLDEASDFLMLPQYFSYLLTGVKKHEYTDASTTGLINVIKKQYDESIIKKLSFPKRIFGQCELPGTFVGYLKPDLVKELGGQIKVVLAPSHDTASAFEAIDVPEDAAILSSGTWSLLGYKTKTPNTSETALAANFTNEGGLGYIRFLKNITGMWLPNQVQSIVGCSIQDMINMAKNSTYREVFDVNDASLVAPTNMKEAVIDLLKKNPPKNDGDLFNSIYHSLAECYKKAIQDLELCLNIKLNSLYIVGGGSKNTYLNQLISSITGLKVVALPIEATAIGNIKIQVKLNG